MPRQRGASKSVSTNRKKELMEQIKRICDGHNVHRDSVTVEWEASGRGVTIKAPQGGIGRIVSRRGQDPIKVLRQIFKENDDDESGNRRPKENFAHSGRHRVV